MDGRVVGGGVVAGAPGPDVDHREEQGAEVEPEPGTIHDNSSNMPPLDTHLAFMRK